MTLTVIIFLMGGINGIRCMVTQTVQVTLAELLLSP